jgi:hypothetical protein
MILMNPAPSGRGSRMRIELGLYLYLGALIAFLLVPASLHGLHGQIKSS